jgi:hypothetical protein
MYLVAISKPTSVLPAPGTPVTKQIDFLLFFLEFNTIDEMKLEVIDIFFASESVLEIFSTE